MSSEVYFPTDEQIDDPRTIVLSRRNLLAPHRFALLSDIELTMFRQQKEFARSPLIIFFDDQSLDVKILKNKTGESGIVREGWSCGAR